MNRFRHVNLFVCSSPLQIVTAHVIATKHTGPDDTSLLVIEGSVDERILDRSLWAEVLLLHDSRRELGDWSGRLAENLHSMRALRARYPSTSATILVSDLQWLMNNVLVAEVFRHPSVQQRWELALFDEGLVLYLQERFGMRHSLRSAAKYLLLRWRGFPALLITAWNSDYRHPLCQRVYCWHPGLLRTRARQPLIGLDPDALAYASKRLKSETKLGAHACLYLSQPLYKLISPETHRQIVGRLKTWVLAQGYTKVYYKPHHHDTTSWRAELEERLGFIPLPELDLLPAEILAAPLNPGMVVGHTSSALANISLQPYLGRIIAFGVDQIVRESRHPFLHRVRQLLEGFPRIEIVA